MAFESLSKIAPALFSPEQDLIEVFNKKTGTIGVINPSYIGGNTPPSGVSGAIQFSNGSAFASDATNLFWDDTNNRLGIGTNAPGTRLEVVGNVFIDGTKTNTIYGGGFILTPGTFFQFRQSLNNDLSFDSFNGGAPISTLFLKQSGGNVGINTVTPTAKLQIKGSGSTSATTSLLVQNSAGNTIVEVLDDGSCTFGRSGGTLIPATFVGSTGIQAIIGNGLFQCPSTIFRVGGGLVTFGGTVNDSTAFTFNHNNSQGSSSVNTVMVNLGGTYNNQASFQFANLQIAPTYDFNANTNTNAVARGIYYNPTITNLRVAQHYAWQNTSGAMIVNSATPQASAILQADSTTQGFLPPRMSTAQINAIVTPAEGLVAYNTTISHLCVYQSGAWAKLSHSPM